MATIAGPGQTWKDAAIEKSQGITDAWEVTKSYLARIAEWVLFACMIMNIIEILPGVVLWPWLINVVLGVQVVMLDVAGFSLASMADHARQNGQEQAAKRATKTGYFLIGLMIVTLLLVTVGILFPWTKDYTDMSEKFLILVRVVMTVVYGHVIHSLRRSTQPALSPVQVAKNVEEAMLEYRDMVQKLLGEVTELKAEIAAILATKNEPVIDTKFDVEVLTKEDAEVYTNEDIDATPIVNIADYRSEHEEDTDSLPVARVSEPTPKPKKVYAKKSSKVTTNNARGEAQERALKVLKKYPNIGPSELCRKAQISRSYATKLIAEKRTENAGA